MLIPFRNALKVLPFLVAPLSVGAASLTDPSSPVLGAAASPSAPVAGNDQSSDLLFQVQQLQQEVQSLRNLVETQRQRLGQVENDGRERYLDVDRRLSEILKQLAERNTAPVQSAGNLAQPEPEEPSLGAVSAGESDRDAYNRAYALIKTQDFDQAVDAFERFTATYTQSALLPNAHYWLGELFMVKNQTDKAESAFQTVISQFPNSRKVPDASYKLGLVYSRYGQIDKAKVQMGKVKAAFPKSTAAKLAEKFLSSQ